MLGSRVCKALGRAHVISKINRDIASHSGSKETRVKKETGNNLDPLYPASPLG
jgi:hypothetical protein